MVPTQQTRVYTPAELEFLSLAKDLYDKVESRQNGQLQAFIATFPLSLNNAKIYFEKITAYELLKEEHAETPESPKLRSEMVSTLTMLEAEISHCFQGYDDPSDPERALKEYLRGHFKVTAAFAAGDRLSFGETRSDAEREQANNALLARMTSLTQENFTPAYNVIVTLTVDVEEHMSHYIAGHQAGDLACSIQLAKRFINLRLQEQDPAQFSAIAQTCGITEADAIQILHEGIKKGYPSAIDAAETFLESYIGTIPNLYSPDFQDNPYLKEYLNVNKALAERLCEDNPKLIANINAMFTIQPDPEQPNKSVMTLAKELKKQIQGDIALYTDGLKMTAAKKVREEHFPIIIDTLVTAIETQLKLPNKNSDNKLKGYQNQLGELKEVARSIEKKDKALDGILADLTKDTEKLPSKNPLRQMINQLNQERMTKKIDPKIDAVRQSTTIAPFFQATQLKKASSPTIKPLTTKKQSPR